MKTLTAIAKSPFFLLPLRLLLGTLFLSAALPKITDATAFAIAIDNYHFLPTALVNLWAIVLPWVELIVGIILILGAGGQRPFDVVTEAAALLSGLMYLSFVIALAWALAKGLDIDCGCFDPNGAGRIDAWYLLRDGSLLAASAVVMWFHRAMLEGER